MVNENLKKTGEMRIYIKLTGKVSIQECYEDLRLSRGDTKAITWVDIPTVYEGEERLIHTLSSSELADMNLPLKKSMPEV